MKKDVFVVQDDCGDIVGVWDSEDAATEQAIGVAGEVWKCRLNDPDVKIVPVECELEDEEEDDEV